MLQGFGVWCIVEVEDGVFGFEVMDCVNFDILILDWVMLIFDGVDMVCMIWMLNNLFVYILIIMVIVYMECSRIVEVC